MELSIESHTCEERLLGLLSTSALNSRVSGIDEELAAVRKKFSERLTSTAFELLEELQEVRTKPKVASKVRKRVLENLEKTVHAYQADVFNYQYQVDSLKSKLDTTNDVKG